MKKIIFIMIGWFLLPSLTGFAADNKKDVRIDRTTPTEKFRPRAPQRHSTVECYYQDGVVTIEFEIPEGDAVFTVTDVMTGDNASTSFNTAMEFNYFIGSEPSTYLLEISTSAGNDYEGYLTID